MHGFELLAAQPFRSQFGYRVGQIHKARRQRALIAGIGAAARHQLAGGRIRHKGEGLLLSGRVEVELDQQTARRGLRIADPGVWLYLDRRQESIGLPFGPNIRDCALRDRRHAAHRPLDLPREHLACGRALQWRLGRAAGPFDIGAGGGSGRHMFAALDAKRSDHPRDAACASHDHERAAVLARDVKLRRIGTVRDGHDSALLTRQRHRARIAVVDLPGIDNFHNALLTLAGRVGNFRLPSARGRIFHRRRRSGPRWPGLRMSARAGDGGDHDRQTEACSDRAHSGRSRSG